jgi:hypothetical protein
LEETMAEENAQGPDTQVQSNATGQPVNKDVDTRPAGDWKPADSPSGADPTLEDDLEAREKELRKMTRSQKGAPSSQDETEDEVENPENLLAQAFDPEAQES